MTTDPLARIVEHNHWTDAALLRVRSALSGEHMDATPRSPRERTIRQVLAHLVESQVGYASMVSPGWRLSTGLGSSPDDPAGAASERGAALRAVADGAASVPWDSDLRTSHGYVVKPWILLVQAINRGAEHRRQVCSLLRALGVEAPRRDGWGFGEATEAVVRTRE